MANELVARKGLIVLDNTKITGSLELSGSARIVGNNTISGSVLISASNIALTVVGDQVISGSLTVTAPLTASSISSSQITGSLFGNVVGNAITATSASHALVADTVNGVGPNVFATTGSNQFTGNQTITGSLAVSAAISASVITASQIIANLTGSMQGNATTATSASYAISSLQAISASNASNADLLDGLNSTVFATTGSNTFVGNQIITGSLTTTAIVIAPIISASQITGSIIGAVIGTASNATSASYASNADLLDGLNSTVFATTGSNIFTGPQTINSSITVQNNISGSELYISNNGIIQGNFTVNGLLTTLSSSTQYVTSSQFFIANNKIIVNVNDLLRFGGISVVDSGSSSPTTASIYWDSLAHRFIYETLSGSLYNSAMFIAGPVNTGATGNEVGLTINRVPVASGVDHIDSRIESSSIRVDFPSRLTHIESGLIVTGSVFANNFTGSFKGDGSQLTGISAGALPSGLISSSLQFNSLTTPFTGSFTGSFTGLANTASLALTAPWSGLTNVPVGLVSNSIQIDHNATINYSANRHIDHTAVSINAGSGLSGGGDISANRTVTLDTGSVHFTGGVTTTINARGVFSSSAQVLHDSTTGYSANRHIDHTAVSISAGTGLTGGGDISTSRTLALTGQALAFHNLSTNGLVVRTTTDTITGRTITAGVGISVNNGDGISGNPTITNTGVTSVVGTGAVSGLTLTGTVTTTGNLTLGGTLAVVPSNFASQTANTFLAAPNGTAGTPTFRAIVAADIPTLNQNTTGTAANVTGVVAIANGGTGQTSQQAALNALAGAVTSGQYLRGNGTNVVMSTIQVADVPTLNQNTTGQAGSVANVVTFNNSGTGDASGITYNGSAARTISHNTIGAVPTGRTLTITTQNGLTGGSAAVDLSANRAWTLELTGQALALHNLATSGLIARTGTGTVAGRTLTAGTGITVTNGDGVAGNPTVALTSNTISGVALGNNLNTLTMGVSGTGLSGTATYNGSAATTFTVTSNATSANTVSTIVARDGSGNFSAGTITATLSGNASSAGIVNGTTGQILRVDDRIIAPADITSGYLQFGFTSWTNNNNAPWADFLHLRSYTDSSGGNDNLVMFRKDAIGMRIYQQSFGSATAYSSFKDVAWTDGTNASGSWGISISGNASTATTLQTARNINGVSFNGSANILVPSIYDVNYRRITQPGGAEYVTGSSTVTGAIRVTLPVGVTNTMVTMRITVYEYTTNESFEIQAGGYPYDPGSNTWANNPFAYITGNPSIDRRFTVRFGHTGTQYCIYIGELGSEWSYPQVFVTDVQMGYSNSSTWISGWSIGFEASAFQNVTATITNSQIGYQASTNTANSVVLRDGSGNFSAGTITATLNGAAPAGSLTGTTLASNVVNSSLTGVGTLTSLTVSGNVTLNSTSGSVGINATPSITHQLIVKGTTADNSRNALLIRDSADAAIAAFRNDKRADLYGDVGVGGNLAVDTNTLYVDATNNRVGVGTASPGYTVDVVGSSSTALNLAAFSNTSSANNTTKTVSAVFRLTDTVGVGKDVAYITAFPEGANVLTGGLAFSTRTGDANPTEKMRLDGSGNLGIGTTSPGGKLEVVGTIRGSEISTANHSLSSTYFAFNDITTNGYLITTNINYTTFNMPTVIIEGYAYGSGLSINLQIVWYAYSPDPSGWTSLSYVNNGGWDPGTVTIGKNSNGKVCIHLSNNIYFGRFNVRCIYDQGYGALEGWSVTHASTSGLTLTRTIPRVTQITDISGNSATTSQTNFSSLTVNSNTVLHAGNYNSYAPTLTGTGASGTWGISISGNAATATSATTTTNWGTYGAVPAAGTSFANANTIGRSDSNGYTYFNYINSNTGNSENPSISQIIVTNGSDNFYRKASIGHLTSAVQNNASGTWGINISGNSATTSQTSFSSLLVGAGAGSNDAAIEVGTGRSASGNAYVDLVGDTTYTDFGTRLQRESGGANARSLFTHRGTGNMEITTPDGGPIVFSISGSERARLTNSGFLKVSNDANLYGNSLNYHQLGTNVNDTRILDLRHSNVSPFGLSIEYLASPNGPGNFFGTFYDPLGVRFQFRSNGGLGNFQANDVNISDLRLKTEINLAPSYWEKIKNIEVVTFKYKDQTHDDVNLGVIAQQVEQVAPELVDVDGFGKTPEDGIPIKTIYTTDLYHATIKALQEAINRIETLETEMVTLKSCIDT